MVGVEVKAPFTAFYMTKAIRPRLWQELQARKNEIGYQAKKDMFIGITLRQNRTYHYIAGIEVTNIRHVPDGMVSMTIPTREYSVYNHSGFNEREETDQTYFFVLEKMKKQGLSHDPDAYSLEIFNPVEENEATIYVPLKES
nr:effector binding domain-containing protein [Alkalihalobacillus sp. AL-G]